MLTAPQMKSTSTNQNNKKSPGNVATIAGASPKEINMVKCIRSIVSRFNGKNKGQPHPRRWYNWQDAPVGVDAVLNYNLAAGRLVYGWAR